MNYRIHATLVHPSLCLQYLFLLFTIATITAVILLLLLLFHYYHHYKTVATDKPLRARLFLGAAELTTHLLRLTYILWLPLCRINKLGFTSLEDCCDPLYLWVITGQTLATPVTRPPWRLPSLCRRVRHCTLALPSRKCPPRRLPARRGRHRGGRCRRRNARPQPRAPVARRRKG
jgi:hypothetical protein